YDAIVPQAGRAIIGGSLPFIGLDHGPFQIRHFPLAGNLAAGPHLIGLDLGKHLGSLMPPHNGNARVRPGEQEARLISASRHGVIAGSEGSSDQDRDHGHPRGRHGGDELGSMLGDAAFLEMAAHHETGYVLQEDERNSAFFAKLYEMDRLEGAFAEKDAVISDNAYGKTLNGRESADHGFAV